MRHSPQMSGQMSVTERTSAAQRVADFLHRLHPIKTAESVGADTGINAETIQKWFDRGSMPSAVCLIYLVGAYGPDFLAACMGDRAPEWLTAAGQDAELARLKAEREALDARIAALRNR